MKLNDDPQAKNYIVSKSYKTVYIVFLVLSLVGGIYFALQPTLNNSWNNLPETLISYGLSLLLFCAVYYFKFVAFQFKIQVFKDKIKRNFVFSTREMDFSEIKGYICSGHSYNLISNDTKKKSMVLSLDIITDPRLESFIIKKFDDLNQVELTRENEEIKQNTLLGDNKNQREIKIKRVELALKIYCGVSVLLLIWGLFSKSALDYVQPTIILVFFSVYFALMYFDKLDINLFNSDRLGIYIAPQLLLPGFYLMLTLRLDFIIDMQKFILPTLFIYLTLTGMSIAFVSSINQIFKEKKFHTYFMLLLPIVFCMGLTGYINENFKVKLESKYQVIIKDKRESKISRNSYNYYFNVSSKDSTKQTQELQVYRSIFINGKIGDTMWVRTFSGFFGIKWYEVE